MLSQDYYYRTFGNERNLGFQVPASDTCKTCEELTTQLRDMASDETEEKKLVQDQLDEHKKAATKGFQMRTMTTQAENEPQAKKVIAFDLQQALPTLGKLGLIILYLREVGPI